MLMVVIEIFVVNSDGSGLTQLTINDVGDYGPSICDDGSKIAFRSEVDVGVSDCELFVVNSDGTGLTQLTNNTAQNWDPSLSYDGSKIAFNSNVDGDWEIFVINSDGTGLTQLTNNTASDHNPTICDDGSKIAFRSEVDGDFEIFLISLCWDFSLTSTLDTYYDVCVVGVNEAATDGFDTAYDQIDPITPPIGMVSYLYYPDNPFSPVNLQKLSKSIMTPASLITWTYKVAPISVSGSLTLSWDLLDIAEVPPEYEITLSCPDDSIVNMRDIQSYTFSAESDTTYTFQIKVGGVNWDLNLNQGWSMVSFPCIPDDASFSSIFSDVPFYQVMTWDGTSYISPTVAEAGVGYWVLVLDETTVTIGNANPVTSYIKSLPAGWSIIGSIYGETMNADGVFPSFYQLLMWNGNAYVSSTTIEPGKGYWALVLEPTTITVG